MPDFDWKNAVATVAPAIATAIGGPAAGLAISALGRVLLGKSDATEDEVAEAVANGMTGDQLLLLKKEENAFKLEMARIAQTEDAAVLADVQDARRRQVETKDYMPQTIFFMLMAVYVFEICLFWFGAVPSDEFVRALMTRAFSTVEVGLTGAIAFFIGSSRGSKRAGDTNRNVAEELARKL